MRPEYSFECSAAAPVGVKLVPVDPPEVGLGQKFAAAILLAMVSMSAAGIMLVTPSPVEMLPEIGSRMKAVPVPQVTCLPVTGSVPPQVTWRVLNGLMVSPVKTGLPRESTAGRLVLGSIA